MANQKNNPIWVDETEEEERLSAEEELIVNVAEDFWEALEVQGMSKKDLADRMGKRKSDISQLLSGNRNLGLRTIADIAYYLGCEAMFKLCPRDHQTVVGGPSEVEIAGREDGWQSLDPQMDGVKVGDRRANPDRHFVFEIPGMTDNEEFSASQSHKQFEWVSEEASNG